MPTLFHMKSTFSSRTIKGFHKTPYIIFFSQDCKNKGKSLYFSKRKKIQFHKLHIYEIFRFADNYNNANFQADCC